MLCRFETSVLIIALAAQCAFAQTAPGSISGRVVSSTGAPVRAIVTILPAASLGFPSGPVHRVLAINNGAFTFAGLRPGQYMICAQIPASEAAKTSAPFLDTCEWGSSLAPIQVAAGQKVTGVTFTAPAGAVLPIQVSDPSGLLPATTSASGPGALDPHLVVIIGGPDKLVHHPRFISQTSGGRAYEAVVPFGTPLTIAVSSSVASVYQNGVPLSGGLPTQFAAGATPSPVTFTLQRPEN